jgi:Nif-specific regulatory protein
MNLLSSCYFPGNVRELENCVRRTATLAHGECILADDFACRHDECMSAVLWKNVSDLSTGPKIPMIASPSPAAVPAPAYNVVQVKTAPLTSAESNEEAAIPDEGMVDVDRARLQDAMEKAGWVQAKAARLLGLTARQIGYALRKHGIEVKKF